MTDYVAYYRVSTDRQGASGLGLEAQRQAVARHVGDGRLAAAFTEIESGRRDGNRPQLHAALAECRKRRAVLLIARLDRLARNVAFIANLMESGVDFVAVDMPTANRLTIHILAAVAEHEREMISARTKAALAQAKARGTQLGNPRPLDALKLANAAKAHLKPAPHVLDLMAGWKAQGKGLREIARELNRLNIRTPRRAVVRLHRPGAALHFERFFMPQSGSPATDEARKQYGLHRAPEQLPMRLSVRPVEVSATPVMVRHAIFFVDEREIADDCLALPCVEIKIF